MRRLVAMYTAPFAPVAKEFSIWPSAPSPIRRSRTRPRLRVQRAHHAVALGDEPDAAGGVGQRGGDALVLAQDGAEVVVALEREPGGGAALGDEEDVPRGGGAPDPVLLVHEEVGATAEVLEQRRARRERLARRQRELGQHVQRLRGEHEQARPVRGDACGHEPPAAVEGDRAAQPPDVGGEHLRRAAQRAGVAVGVRLPRVVVQLAERIGRHEGVLVRARHPADGLRLGRLARERRERGGRSGRDRRGRPRSGGQREGQAEKSQQKGGAGGSDGPGS